MDWEVHSSLETDGLVYNHITKKEKKKSDYEPHTHDACEIIFVKAGHVSYYVDGRKYPIFRDTLILSRPGDIHCVTVDEVKPYYERYDILFGRSSLHSDVWERLPSDLNVIDFSQNERVVSIFESIDYYASSLSEENFGALLLSLIEEILFNALIEVSKQKERRYTEINPTVERAVRYIDSHLYTLTGLDEVAREIYVTKGHLHHLFIKHLKITPKSYIMTKRLAKARADIYNGEKVTRVFERCGFSDYSSFFRAYKKHFGTSPSKMSTDGGSVNASESLDGGYDT